MPPNLPISQKLLDIPNRLGFPHNTQAAFRPSLNMDIVPSIDGSYMADFPCRSRNGERLVVANWRVGWVNVGVGLTQLKVGRERRHSRRRAIDRLER
jgi:hypothetical protein